MRINRKKLFAVASLFTLLMGFVGPFVVTPQKVEAGPYSVRCNGANRLNRPGCYGYFRGIRYHTEANGIQGHNIIDCTRAPANCTGGEGVNNAIPASVNTANELIAYIQKHLFNTGGTSYNYNKAGAAFIVDAMLGRYGTDYGTTAAGVAYAQANFGRWSDAVRFYEAQGWITWNEVRTIPTGYVNSMHACWPSIADCNAGNIASHDSQDFAFYRNPGPEPSHIIIFRNPDGTRFEIRRECANLLGQVENLSMPTFNLSPTVNATVNGVAGGVAQIGDTVRFTYTVTNSGGTSAGTACNTYANNYTGYHAASNPAVAGGPAGPNPGCPRNFPGGATTVATENIVITTENQTLCRSLFVNPYRYGQGALGRETCVIVAAKPYLKVFGGDISAGNALESAPNTCTSNGNAKVVAWNKRNAGGYAGSGAQYATYALNTITDFASAQGNTGGAPVSVGLSFANTVNNNPAVGNMGGSFGSAVCIPNYYARMNGTPPNYPGNISAMTGGAYRGTPGMTIGPGVINPGEKNTLYVSGDVYINGNITYAGSWDALNIPLFQLVVTGNIYIDNDVTQLDGVYIAQRSSAGSTTTGKIFTCATGAGAAASPTGPSYYNDCDTRLTINGAFVASSVEFLRTLGTLSQSQPGTAESRTSTNGAEVFNFNPTLWMVQPVDGSGRVDNYDAITSLPPVL
jgi:hypothetical protein